MLVIFGSINELPTYHLVTIVSANTLDPTEERDANSTQRVVSVQPFVMLPDLQQPAALFLVLTAQI